jgi:hypothetical protein
MLDDFYLESFKVRPRLLTPSRL